MVNIQTRKITDDLASLVKELDDMVDGADEMTRDTNHAFLVYITDDPEAAAKELEALAKKHEIENIPLTVFDGNSGPRGYKIAKDAEVTVMMWERTRVSVNHAFAAGEFNEAAAKDVLKNAKEHVQ